MVEQAILGVCMLSVAAGVFYWLRGMAGLAVHVQRVKPKSLMPADLWLYLRDASAGAAPPKPRKHLLLGLALFGGGGLAATLFSIYREGGQ
jgi:hypothetical protein